MSSGTENPAPLRVCSFESRRHQEMASLLSRAGAVATVAPSMREVPLSENTAATDFFQRLLAGEFDVLLFMTGVGAKTLLETLALSAGRDEVVGAMNACPFILVRGPKPTAVLRDWGIRIDARAPEPNTWREMVQVLDDRGTPLRGCRIAIQEYGRPSNELYDALDARGAVVFPVPIYRWALPEDTGPLEQAVRTTIEGGFDVLMFTSAQQLENVLEVADRIGAREPWLNAARQCLIASIGPTASETLREAGLPPDVEPSHGTMGHLVREACTAARDRRGSSA